MKETIAEIENHLQVKLQDFIETLLPNYSLKGYSPRASLQDGKGRKKRSDASAANWSPESGRIEIRFELATPDPKSAESGKVVPGISARPVTPLTADGLLTAHSKEYSDPTADVLRALYRAECQPGWSFVSLKKFRDEILAFQDIPSVRTDVERHAVLVHAIEEKLILVGKVPNPKAPQFPVTTIRLNRSMSEVQRVVGLEGNPYVDFHPIEISGEPLSTTILRERR